MFNIAMLGLIFLVFILGISIGSFLNVVILRALSGESIVMPPSKCPKCQYKLNWWHNIPLLSFAILRGKCAFCGEKISWQYPVVELLTGFMFVITFFKYGVTLDTLLIWIIGSLFIVMAVTDWKEKVIFDWHAYVIIAISLSYALFLTGMNLYQSFALVGSIEPMALLTSPFAHALIGMIIGILVIECFARLGKLLCGTRLFGEGDTYIMAALGTIFGWKIVCIIFVCAIILQVIVTIPFFIKKEFEQKNWRTLVSFIGFILCACIFCASGKLLVQNTLLYISLAVILAILGIWACVEIIKGLKNPINRTLLPFGPALIISGFIFMFLLV